eukprot:5968124-Pyramimonas_sp.AAC.1
MEGMNATIGLVNARRLQASPSQLRWMEVREGMHFRASIVRHNEVYKDRRQWRHQTDPFLGSSDHTTQYRKP